MTVPEIAALGDLAFVGRYDGNSRIDPLGLVAGLLTRFDLVIGNLESPLTDSSRPVSSKCTLRGNPKWAARLRRAGVHVLSLANNHLMDHGPEGLLDTMDNLDRAGIQWLGAGHDLKEASAPLYLEVNGRKIALIARSSVIVASPCYAGRSTPGVARFDLQETAAALQTCRSRADRVLLLLHWGLEHYRYPAPSQRALARQLIEAGADFIIGHHPHVLQGCESIKGGAVAYSLGNFLFDHFSWRFIEPDGNAQEQEIRLSTRHLESGILSLAPDESSALPFDFLPTRIQANTVITPDPSSRRQTEMQRLSRPFKRPAYSLFWRLHALEREWRLRFLPLVRGKLSWQHLKKIRPRHFAQLIKTVRRSAGIAREKSTNPYE